MTIASQNLYLIVLSNMYKTVVILREAPPAICFCHVYHEPIKFYFRSEHEYDKDACSTLVHDKNNWVICHPDSWLKLYNTNMITDLGNE